MSSEQSQPMREKIPPLDVSGWTVDQMLSEYYRATAQYDVDWEAAQLLVPMPNTPPIDNENNRYLMALGPGIDVEATRNPAACRALFERLRRHDDPRWRTRATDFIISLLRHDTAEGGTGLEATIAGWVDLLRDKDRDVAEEARMPLRDMLVVDETQELLGRLTLQQMRWVIRAVI